MPNYVPYDDTYHTSAPTGWNHWLAFFRQVTEKDIVDHADFISKELKPYDIANSMMVMIILTVVCGVKIGIRKHFLMVLNGWLNI